MAKRPKQKRTSQFPPAADPRTPVQAPQRRWGLVILFLTISLGGTYLAILLRPKDETPRYRFEVISKIDHDPAAFTQGLLAHDGYLWESTGRYEQSSIRKLELDTGKVLKQIALEDQYFGEGLACLDDKLYQLTWKSGKAFVYDLDLNLIGQREYSGQGWGLTSDGESLIFSDGSRVLKFLDPETFEERRSILVRQRSGANVGQLNELEYFEGKIYANRYQSDLVYEIDPETGDVTKVINLGGLWRTSERPTDGILNGIAVHPESKKLLVTGKLCPFIYELRLFPEEN